MSAESSITKKTYWIIFAWLMGLLILTVVIAYIHIPIAWLAVTIAMTIAVIKASLVVWYFMHVKENSRLTWLFVGAGFFWLLIMIGITMTDYGTRSWETQGYQSKQQEFSSPYKVPAKMYDQNEHYVGHGAHEAPEGEGAAEH